MDNCGISSYYASLKTFTTSDLGKNDVTLSVTDSSNNTTECIFTVTVLEYSLNTINSDFDNLSISPNPTRGLITLKNIPENSQYTIEVYDLTGNPLKTNNNTEINLRCFSSGIYFIKLKNDTGQVIKKVFKK